MSDIQPPLKKQKIGLNDNLSESSTWKSNHHKGSTIIEGVLIPNLIWSKYFHTKMIPDVPMKFDNCNPKKSVTIPSKYIEDITSSKKMTDHYLNYPIIEIPKNNVDHSMIAGGENCSDNINISNMIHTLPYKKLKTHEVGCNGDGSHISLKLSSHTQISSNTSTNLQSKKPLNASVHEFNETEMAVNSMLDAGGFNNNSNIDLNNGYDNYDSSRVSDFNNEIVTNQKIPLGKLFPCKPQSFLKSQSENIKASDLNSELVNGYNYSSDLNIFSNSQINLSQHRTTCESLLSTVKIKNNMTSNDSSNCDLSLNNSQSDIADNKEIELSVASLDRMDLTKSCINPNLIGAVNKISILFENSDFKKKLDNAVKLDMNENVVLSKYDILSRKLVLLLHAFSCLVNCFLSNCDVIRKLWWHMVACCDKTCNVPMCKSSCQIIRHFSDCATVSCEVCSRLQIPKSNHKLNGCRVNCVNSSPYKQQQQINNWTSFYLTRSSAPNKTEPLDNKIWQSESLVINRSLKPVEEKVWSQEELDRKLSPLLDQMFHCKKEKSTDCDSALIQLLCVHG